MSRSIRANWDDQAAFFKHRLAVVTLPCFMYLAQAYDMFLTRMYTVALLRVVKTSFAVYVPYDSFVIAEKSTPIPPGPSWL